MASPEFSLQIPFIMIGTRDVPETMYNFAERKTKPLLAVESVIQHFCPDIPCSVWIPGAPNKNGKDDRSRSRLRDFELEEKKRWKDTRNSGWVIRLGKGERRLGWIGKYQDGDGQLGEMEKRRLANVGGGGWSVPVLLQRFGNSLERKADLEREVRSVMKALKSGFSWRGLKILANERCQVKVAVEPGRGGLVGVFEGEMVAKVLLALGAFEREMACVAEMSEVLRFFSVSRFMEYWRVRELRRERRGLTKGTKGKEGERFDYNLERWKKDVQTEDIMDLLEGRDGWEMVDDVYQDGKMEELVRAMEGVESGSGRMGVAFPLAHPTSPGHEEETVPANPNEKDDETDSDLANRSRASTPEPAHSEAFPGVEAIVFQGHRSTLDADDVCAYVDFVTQLVAYATSHSYPTLRQHVQGFRQTVSDRDETPPASLNRLCDFVSTRRETRDYYREVLERRFAGPQVQEKKKDDEEVEEKRGRKMGREDAVKSPLNAVLKVIDERRENEEVYMRTFIERYEGAGGFRALGRKKVYALMVAEEDSEENSQKEKR